MVYEPGSESDTLVSIYADDLMLLMDKQLNNCYIKKLVEVYFLTIIILFIINMQYSVLNRSLQAEKA